MGVDLNIWSNHELRFNSFEEGIEMFEKKTSRKIKQWNFKIDEPIKKTKNISDVEYFTHFEILNHNFEKWNEIKLWSNFEFCDELKLLRQTLKIHPTKFRIRHSKWLQLVTKNYETDDEVELHKMKESRKNWLQFREYALDITKKLGGDKVIYLNDHSFQNEEDLFYQGNSLEKGIKHLSEIVIPCELELLELFPSDIRTTSSWHFDEIKK